MTHKSFDKSKSLSARTLRLPSLRAALYFVLLLLAIGLSVLFVFDGNIDKGVAAFFYDPQHGFTARHDSFITTLRLSTRLTAVGVGVFLIFGLIRRVILGRRFFGLTRAAIVYLIAVFLLGPALLVNGVLKEESGRARPSQIIEFGGTEHYTPPLTIAHQCTHNCSFVAGEPALGFAFVAFGFAAATRRGRRLGIAIGVGLGSAFGLLRIAQGGHFLSDVFFAGLLMLAVAWLLHRLLIASSWLDRLGLWPRKEST